MSGSQNTLVEFGLQASGTTANRPANAEHGARYFNSDLGVLECQDDLHGGFHPAGGIVVEQRTFTETDGAGNYTGTVNVPAGASILDIVIDGIALWTASTSATLKVGDATDDDGFFTAVNLKATDLLAGESLSLGFAGGKAGAYVANSQVSPRYSATARAIAGVVTTVGTTGTAGRTRMTVIYTLPRVTAATKA